MKWLTALALSYLSYLYLDQTIAILLNKHTSYSYIFTLLSLFIAPFPHLILWGALTTSAFHPRMKAYFRSFCIAFLTMGIIMLIAGILKIVIGRARPEFFLKTGFYGFSFFDGIHSYYRSFPSSHSATAFGLTYLAVILRKPARPWIWYSTAALLVSSRLFLGEHYLSDVIVGGIIGIFTAKQIEQVIHLLDLKSKKS